MSLPSLTKKSSREAMRTRPAQAAHVLLTDRAAPLTHPFDCGCLELDLTRNPAVSLCTARGSCHDHKSKGGQWVPNFSAEEVSCPFRKLTSHQPCAQPSAAKVGAAAPRPAGGLRAQRAAAGRNKGCFCEDRETLLQHKPQSQGFILPDVDTGAKLAGPCN